ncbi:hypothetical protein MED92_06518 [Oceanospirillum sp. MED92]|uniref:Pentraxin (PTX) domain-containing protein n=2 Tax=Neptuniibacter caesariensis TaxID=207954 RepID=A0A7U8CAB7_NEPCE|nr:hypothetical protein MED92_06518 [Oceanospirillum sp. MED92] [Neptuniibacter caesariensis]
MPQFWTVSLFLIFLCLFLRSANAATVTYDFSAGSHTSYAGDNSSLTSTSGLSTFNDSRINFSDGSYAGISASRSNYPKMLYSFSISESASDLSQITATWVGRGYHSSNGQNGAILYIRNYSSGSFEQLATSSSSGFITLSGSVTSSLSNYVSSGQIQILSVNRRFRQNRNHSVWHDTDYIKIDLETNAATPIPNPEIEYRMDELQWQGTANEVVDNTGNNHDGTAQGGVTTIENGAVCRAGEFDGSDDYVSAIDLSALRGTSSISYWVKTSQVGSSVTYLSPGITGIEINGSTNDIFWGWLNNSGRVGVSVGDNHSTVSASSINNNTWRHVVLTRDASSGAYQIFIDGALNASGTSTTGTISNSFSSIGRIEDNGGSPEYFQGQLDEVLIYDSVLSAAHVTQIYTNQSAGNNWDGTSRTCPVNSAPLPKAEFRLDELSWNGTLNEVVDSVGTYSGEAINTSPVAGKICNAADFSATNSSGDADNAHDYIKLDGDIYSNQGDFSISLWVKTANTSDQSLVSGATSGSSNELIMWFTSSTSFTPHLNNSNGGSATVGNFADDTWRHLVWTRSGTQNCLYMDKVLQGCRTLGAANITLANNGLVLAQEQDSVGGGFVGSQAFDGLMDEVLFYDKALSSAEITFIHDLQDAGKNLDGTDRSCPVENVTPVADWRFDENSWSGTDDVLDTSGNNYHGTAFSTSPSDDAQLCNSANLTASGTSDYLRMNKDALDGLRDFTVIVWAKTTATQDSTILSAASGNSGAETNEAVMYFDNNNRFWPTITDSPFDTNTQLSSTSSSMRDGAWHQLAWTRTASSRQSCFYLDGVNQGCTTHPDADDSDPISVATNGLIIGQEQDSVGGGFDSSQDWEGYLDEMLIFSSVLSQAKISEIRTNIINSNNWDGTPRSCQAAIDHYSISHDGTGVTCLLENVTISAHDSAHTAVDAEGKTVNLSTTNGKGNWVGIVSGGTGLNNGTADDGAASFTFAAGATSAVLTFAHPVLSGNSETFGFNVTDGSISETSGSAIAADDPNITYQLAGFRFIDSSGNSLPLQISGKASNVAPDADTLYLQAVRASDNDPSICTAALSGNQTIQLAAQCDNPATCVSGQTFNVQSASNPAVNISLNNAAPATPASYSNIVMTFDAQARAPFVMNYSDAGQMQLHASHTVSDTGAVLTGSSNQFVVRPFAFGIPSVSASGAAMSLPAGDETGGNAFTSAGSDFVVSLNAYRWNSGDDGNSDGAPDAGADVTNNGVTPNFTGTATLAVDSFTPASGVQGTLSGDASVLLDIYSNRSGADVPATLQYDEVGSINLSASMDDYLGDSNADIASVSTKIGRFYPDHFALQTVTLTAACTSGAHYTYMQQPFAQLAYTLEARPAGVTDSTGTNGRITQNYDDDFYNDGSSPLTALIEGFAENNDSGVDIGSRVTAYTSTTSWQDGVYSVSRTNETFFSRNGAAGGLEDGPFSQLQLGIGIGTELDNRTFATSELDMNSSTSGDCVAAGNCTAAALGSAQDLRYGRVRIQSAHAPETEDLPVPFSVEYWNGSAFVTNADDSCSVIPAGQIEFNSVATSTSLDVSYDQNADTDTTGSFTDLSGGNVTASNGSFGLQFSAPGVGVEGNDNTGSFPVEVLNLDDWLRYDWNEDGSADDANAQDAIITFGRARGSDRMIFWQERYQ